MERAEIKETSRLSIASIICVPAAIGSALFFTFLTLVGAHKAAGFFVALTVLFFVLAFVLGCVSFAVIVIWHKRTKGLIWAILSILLSVFPMVIIGGLEMGVRARLKRKKEWTALYNLEILGKELEKYARDNKGCLPLANRWCDLLMEYNKNLTKENFRHPQPELFRDMFHFEGECQIAFNKNLSGMRLSDIPDDVVLLFEADGDWNLNGTEELLRTRYRERGYIAVLFADQTVSNYWFYKKAIRKFDKHGMYYEPTRWHP